MVSVVRHSKLGEFELSEGNRRVSIKALAASSEVVFLNFGAKYVRDHKPEDLVSLISGNILLPSVILESLTQTVQKVYLVNLTSYWQYWYHTSHSPKNLYAACKNAFSEIVKFYEFGDGFEAINVVCGDTFGNGDSRNRLVPHLVGLVATSKRTRILHPFHPVEPLWLDDLVNEVNCLIEERSEWKAIENRTISLFHNSEYLVKDLVQALMNRFPSLTDLVELDTQSEAPIGQFRPWRRIRCENRGSRLTSLQDSINALCDDHKP